MKCVMPPAGEEEQKSKKGRRKDEDQASDGRSTHSKWPPRHVTCVVESPAAHCPPCPLPPLDGSDGGRVSRTVLERWRESLLSCSSLSQVGSPAHQPATLSLIDWDETLNGSRSLHEHVLS